MKYQLIQQSKQEFCVQEISYNPQHNETEKLKSHDKTLSSWQ